MINHKKQQFPIPDFPYLKIKLSIKLQYYRTTQLEVIEIGTKNVMFMLK